MGLFSLLPGYNAFSVEYFAQAMDAAGNVTMSNNKALNYAGDISKVYLPFAMRNR